MLCCELVISLWAGNLESRKGGSNVAPWEDDVLSLAHLPAADRPPPLSVSVVKFVGPNLTEEEYKYLKVGQCLLLEGSAHTSPSPIFPSWCILLPKATRLSSPWRTRDKPGQPSRTASALKSETRRPRDLHAVIMAARARLRSMTSLPWFVRRLSSRRTTYPFGPGVIVRAWPSSPRRSCLFNIGPCKPLDVDAAGNMLRR